MSRQIGAMNFYQGLVDGSRKPPDLYLVSPCKRTLQTMEPYLKAHKRFTGEQPKVIATWALREQAGRAHSGVDTKSWDIPTITGSLAPDDDSAWNKSGCESDLGPRAQDVKSLFSTLGSEIHARTGEGEFKCGRRDIALWVLMTRYFHHGLLAGQHRQRHKEGLLWRKITFDSQRPEDHLRPGSSYGDLEAQRRLSTHRS